MFMNSLCTSKLSTVEEVLDDLKKGKMVILVDNEDRENEGDLLIAAEHVTAESINFMARHARGLICVPLKLERLRELDLGPMVQENTAVLQTAFTVSVDVIKGTSTGISASDRAKTVQALINSKTKPSDLGRPGHIFPLMSKRGGVLVRAGQTEGSVDLCSLAGLYPGAVICEIMNEDGSMSRRDDLGKFANRYDLKIISIAQIIAFRMRQEKLVYQVSKAHLPTKYGDFSVFAYANKIDDSTHLALVHGRWHSGEPVLVRVHSECVTGDILGSLRCDCGEQLALALKMIVREGAGVCVYMKQEGRGIGLDNKMRAYELQDRGLDTVEANQFLGLGVDSRDYGLGAQILKDLKVDRVRIMTNNPKKVLGIEGYELDIVERVPIIIRPNKNNSAYLRTKQEKLGHILNL